MLNKSWRIALDLIVAAGALACIFVWFGIKPGELRMIPTWPRILWLVLGLVLFALSIGVSCYSIFRSRQEAIMLRAQRDSAVAEASSFKAELAGAIDAHRREAARLQEMWRQRAVAILRRVSHRNEAKLASLMANHAKEISARQSSSLPEASQQLSASTFPTISSLIQSDSSKGSQPSRFFPNCVL